MRENKLIAMMPVYNEADRFLSRVLEHLSLWVDEIVVLNDGSTDQTADICRQYAKVFLTENGKHGFHCHEALLRKRLWDITIEQNPDWILAIDADEIFTNRIITEIDSYLNQTVYDSFAFRIFDFWKSEEFCRVDGGWNPWNRFCPMLIRYDPGQQTSWPDLAIHSGRLPIEYRRRDHTFQSDIRVKHYGWAQAEDHYRKFLFYRKKNIEQDNEVHPHTLSIMSSSGNIILEKWFE